MTIGNSRRGRPRAQQENVRHAYKIKCIRDTLGLPNDLKTYRALADEISDRSGVRITCGTLYRLFEGREPKRNDKRRALGLPEYVTVVACAKCGSKHDEIKTCPSKRKFRRPRKPWVPPLLAAIRAACRRMTAKEVDELQRRCHV